MDQKMRTAATRFSSAVDFLDVVTGEIPAWDQSTIDAGTPR
jgi:hypothetical protein